MATKTTNYELVKPALSDSPDITAMNVNWDILDAEMKARYKIGSLSKKITNPASPISLDQYILGLNAECLYFTGNKGTHSNITGIPNDIVNDYMVTVMGGNTYSNLYYATITVESMFGNKVKYFGQIFNSGSFTGWVKVLTTNDDYKPNLLINGDFKVWQRGSSFYSYGGMSQYAADRWKLVSKGGAVVLQQTQTGAQFIVDQPGVSDNLAYIVPPEDAEKLIGRTVTLSMKIWASQATVLGMIFFDITGSNTAKTFNISAGWQTLSLTTTIDSITSGSRTIHIQPIRSMGAGYVDIEYIKLEINDHATPNVPKSFTEELAQCKRYFQYMPMGTLCKALDTTTVSFCFPYPVQMRTSPTARIVIPNFNFIGITNGTAPQRTGQAIYYANLSYTGAREFVVGGSSGTGTFTANQPYALTTEGAIAFDAEL